MAHHPAGTGELTFHHQRSGRDDRPGFLDDVHVLRPRFDVPNPVDEIDGCDVADGGQDGEELQEALGVIAGLEPAHEHLRPRVRALRLAHALGGGPAFVSSYGHQQRSRGATALAQQVGLAE